MFSGVTLNGLDRNLAAPLAGLRFSFLQDFLRQDRSLMLRFVPNLSEELFLGLLLGHPRDLLQALLHLGRRLLDLLFRGLQLIFSALDLVLPVIKPGFTLGYILEFLVETVLALRES